MLDISRQAKRGAFCFASPFSFLSTRAASIIELSKHSAQNNSGSYKLTLVVRSHLCKLMCRRDALAWLLKNCPIELFVFVTSDGSSEMKTRPWLRFQRFPPFLWYVVRGLWQCVKITLRVGHWKFVRVTSNDRNHHIVYLFLSHILMLNEL